MDVKLRLFAGLRDRAGESEWIERGLPAELDVAGLKRELEARHPEWGALRHVRAVLGTRYVRDDTLLPEGEEVALLPPVSGGSPGTDADPDAELERGVFELVAADLDAEGCRRRVTDPACGATVVFSGTTRDTNRGRDVERLEYEAFEAMAGPEMERIFARCREQHGDADGSNPQHRLRMICQHRTGSVGIGEPSVVIAIASPHRDRAFLACRFLIDELKASLPVWKKELYPGGEHWIGDRS